MESNTPKILIAVPCMDSVAAQFAQALAMLEKVGSCLVSFVIGSLIYNSRNDLARQAMKMDCTHILWLDSDMVFPPETLKYLYDEMENTGADFISGLYFRRCAPFSPVAFGSLPNRIRAERILARDTGLCQDALGFPRLELLQTSRTLHMRSRCRSLSGPSAMCL